MNNPLSQPLLRGGQKLKINQVSDRFAIRAKKGVDLQRLSDQMGCELKQHLKQQDLTVVEVSVHARGMVKNQMDQQDTVEFTSNVITLEGSPTENLYLTDEITLQFQEGTNQDIIEAIAEEFGLQFIKAVKGLADCYVFKILPNSSPDPIEITNKLLTYEAVKWCEPNIVVPQQHYYIPDDNLFSQQWHLFNQGGIQLDPNAHIDAINAWQITKGERSVIVAIADDSIDIAHKDFTGPGKIVSPRDFQGFDFNPSPDNAQENHGTAVAGVAVAESNGSGVVGSAPGCALMPIRTSGFLDDNSIEALFEWAADNGASVISNSWGAAAINFPLSIRQSNAISRAAREGRNGKGCVILFAAGNSNRPVNGIVDEKEWPNEVLSGPTVWMDGFATHPDVIAVSASTSLNKKSFYSSWGKEISVCAPSNNGHPGIGTSPTYPFIRGSFPGRGILTTDRVGPVGYSSADYTNNFGGTSSACPLAAGVAALVLSANPDLTAAEVKKILESTADKIIDDSTDPQLGNAFGNYDENGHSQWFGYGKVNAFKAVQEAQRRLSGIEKPSEIVQANSSPNIAIPDNDVRGISDQITIARKGTLEDIQLKLDISHTYIGDLVVELIAPSGKSVLLHNRNGGSADDLRETYTIEKFANLKALVGELVEGTWQLNVWDAANLDTGILNFWEVAIEMQPSAAITIAEQPGLLIPDADPGGIQRTLNFNREGTINDIKVSVDITHTFISDLIVTLVTPSGKEISLHEREGGSTDNILATYSGKDHADLKNLLGEQANGDWVLSVKDMVARDTGKLNAWGIEIELTETEE